MARSTCWPRWKPGGAGWPVISPDFDAQAVSWQAGQHHPDRVAAAVVAFDVLDHAAGQRWNIAS